MKTAVRCLDAFVEDYSETSLKIYQPQAPCTSWILRTAVKVDSNQTHINSLALLKALTGIATLLSQ
jgi:hypothetical protein